MISDRNKQAFLRRLEKPKKKNSIIVILCVCPTTSVGKNPSVKGSRIHLTYHPGSRNKTVADRRRSVSGWEGGTPPHTGEPCAFAAKARKTFEK